MESCPSRSKEHDWKSCKRPKPFRGFESLALRQKNPSLMTWIFSFMSEGHNFILRVALANFISGLPELHKT